MESDYRNRIGVVHSSRPQTMPRAKEPIDHLDRMAGGSRREWLSTPSLMRGSLNGGFRKDCTVQL
jgi:hypothetical protein